MAKLSIAKGSTSVLARIFVQDSTSTTGAGKSGLTAASFTNTKAYVSRDDDGNAAATGLTLTDSTRGTWSSGGVKEKDATNSVGVYELGLSDASLATGSRSVTYYLYGSGIAPVVLEIELTGPNNQDAVRGGMTALPNAAANAAGGLPISAAGALDLDEMNVDIEAIQASTAGLTFTGAGKVDASVRDWVGDAIPARNVTGVPIVDCKYLLGTVFVTPATAGILDINVKNMNNVAATAITTIKAVQGLAVDGVVTTVTNQLTAAQVATGIWQDTTAGDFTTALSVGKSIMNGVALGTGLTINAYTGDTPQTGDSFARIGALGAGLTAVGISSNIKKNQALAKFQFMMTDTTNNAPKTGLTVTVTRSIDNGVFGAGTLSAVTEISNGMYSVDFGAGDLNGNVIVLRATAAASNDTFERIVTQP